MPKLPDMSQSAIQKRQVMTKEAQAIAAAKPQVTPPAPKPRIAKKR